jgi:hypothetical protein
MGEAAVYVQSHVLVAFVTVALLFIAIGYNAWQGQEWHCLHGIACTAACTMAGFACIIGPAAPTKKTQ